MANKTLYPAIILAFVVGISLSAVYAADLPTDFDVPCPSGMSVLQTICVGVNLNHDKIDVNTSDITVIEGELTTIEDHIANHHTEVAVLNAENDGIEARLLALETQQFVIEFDMEIESSLDGALRTHHKIILYHGDELCKIRADDTSVPSLFIKFAKDTNVLHLTDCAPTKNGVTLNLTNSTNQVFPAGSILVVMNNFSVFDETYRDLS